MDAQIPNLLPHQFPQWPNFGQSHQFGVSLHTSLRDQFNMGSWAVAFRQHLPYWGVGSLCFVVWPDAWVAVSFNRELDASQQ
jgi:hypothetical protein